MDLQDLKQFLRYLDVETTKKLDLSNKDINEIPPEIGRFNKLEELNLSYNSLTKLPDEICQLTNLKALLLLRNKLSYLPEDFSQLNKLELLDISYNNIKELPPGFESLADLQSFDMSFNKIKRLPLEFTQLLSLKDVHLEDNPFEFPPKKVIKRGLYATMYYLTEEKKRQHATRVNMHIYNFPERIQPLFKQYISYFNEMISEENQPFFDFDIHYINPSPEDNVIVDAQRENHLFDFLSFIKENIDTLKTAPSVRPDVSLFESQVRDLKTQMTSFNHSMNQKVNEIKELQNRVKYLSSLIEE